MTRRALAMLTLVVFAAGCPKGGANSAYPTAEVFEAPSDFAGRWRGEVGGLSGALEIAPLGEGRYLGRFEGNHHKIRYSLSMEHVVGKAPSGDEAASNLVKFTWQDGRGGRGAGWLMINREDSALAGEYGRGEGRATGLGEWAFIRSAGSGPAPNE